jgi:hypothetical protein
VPGPIAETLGVLFLVATLVFAVARPRCLPEVVVALPAAVLLLAVGAVSGAEASAEAHMLLVWPDEPPGTESIPPPPHPPPPPPGPPA